MSPQRKIIHEEKIIVGGKKKSPLRGALENAVSSVAHKKNNADSDQAVDKQSQAKSVETTDADNRPAIVFVVTQALWEERQKYIVRVAEQYASQYQIHLIFGTFEFTGNNVLREKIESLGGVAHPIDALANRNVLANEIGAIIGIRKVLARVKPAVVHTQDAKATMLTGLAMLTGVKGRLVATVHELLDFSQIKKSEAPLVKFFIKTSYGMARSIITRDQHTYNRSVSLWGKKKVVMILPAITDIEFTNPQEKLRAIAQDASAACAGILQDQSTTIIGNVAPLEADQGIAFTLHAVKLLQDRGYSIAYLHYGIGDQERLLEHEIGQFGLQDRVILKGLDKMASAYLPVFDVVVHPTLKPGVPSLLRETALAKRPMVITDVAGVNESVVHNSEAVVVEQGSAEAIADAIEYLITNKSQAQAMGEALYQRVQHDYNAQTMIEKTSQVYGIS